VLCGLQNGFRPNDTKITSNDVKDLFVHGFIFDVETFGFDACFFEVVESADEAFSLSDASGAKGKSCLQVAVLVAVLLPVGVSN